MKTDDLIYRSILIITEYYKNNLQPFFDSTSDDILWIGPAEHQLMQGKDIFIKSFMAERHELTFTMGDIKTTCIAPNKNVREIILHYKIYTHFPSSSIDINGSLPDFEQSYPDFLLRIHASYLINPAHVQKIRRFAVILTGGTELPIPEKKYTAIKKLLLMKSTEPQPEK